MIKIFHADASGFKYVSNEKNEAQTDTSCRLGGRTAQWTVVKLSNDERPSLQGSLQGTKGRHTGKATAHSSNGSVRGYLQKTAALGFEHNSLKVVDDCLKKRINLNSFYIITKYKNFIYRDCLQM